MKTNSLNENASVLKSPRLVTLLGLALLVAVLKAVPYLFDDPISLMQNGYLWNFSLVFPLAVFCGAFLNRYPWMIVVPMLAMLLGDIGIGALSGHWEWAFYSTAWINYVGYLSIIGAGLLLHPLVKKPWLAIIGCGFSGGTAFFLVTNFLIWILGDRTIYPYSYDLSGLLECYALAIPFYRNSLISMFLFLPVLFSQAGLVSIFPEQRLELSNTKKVIES